MGPYARVCDKALITVGGAETKQGNPIQVLGYRLVVIDEVDGSDKIDKGVMKKLTGRDSLSGAFLFEETQMFRSAAKPLIIANKLPYMDGTGDPAAWERVQALGYNVTIAKKDRIEDFENILFETEGEMILAWMIQGAYDALNGYIDWVTDQQMPRGMNAPEDVSGRTEEWRQSFDVLGEFIEDWCNIGEGFQSRAKRLFDHFMAFMKSEGYNQTWTKKRFGREIVAKRAKTKNGNVVQFKRERTDDLKRETIYLNIEPRYVEEATNN
jgi:phage/plasmid-associated DNA primase